MLIIVMQLSANGWLFNMPIQLHLNLPFSVFVFAISIRCFTHLLHQQ